MSTWIKRSSLTLSVGLVLISVIVIGFGARASANATDSPLALPDHAALSAQPAAASLHNPAFNNEIWYAFHERHGYGTNLTPESWVPDDDTPNGPQQWMLWYYDGTVPLLTWASQDVHEGNSKQGDRAVKGRTYWNGKHQAGIYQQIYNATPCLTYEFQMYGKAKLGEAGDRLLQFRVGIDQRGYRPDTWAVHAFPSTTVWGVSHPEYIDRYGLLTVTAEALDAKISVFTYAEADGGVSFETLWDTGSFREATPAMVHDPDNLPAPNGILNLNQNVSSTSATITWQTSNPALSQVYYRLVPQSGGTAEPYPNNVYAPSIRGASLRTWSATALDKTLGTVHSATLTNLVSGRTYKFIAVSRGLSNSQCVTWVSMEQTLTTP
jgi:hypothetical protein